MENNSNILLLSGLPGVGKSELSKELIKQRNAISISTDDVRQEIFIDPKLTIEETALVYEECAKRIEKYSESDYQTVIVDTTCLPKNGERDDRLLVASEAAAIKTGRFLLKLALIASPETIIERNYSRAAYNTDKEIGGIYPLKVLELEKLFSWSLPMGENWNYIDTDNTTKLELARIAISMLSNSDQEKPETNSQINSIMAQFYSDTFHDKLLDCWAEFEEYNNEIPSTIKRFSKYSKNCGILNTYDFSINSLSDDGSQNNLISLFRTINKKVKNNCFFTPENGTLLRNVTAFCLNVISNTAKGYEIAPWIDNSCIRKCTTSIKMPDTNCKHPLKQYEFEILNGDGNFIECTLSTIIKNQCEKLLNIKTLEH